MHVRFWLIIVLLLGACQAAPELPNVVVILADDLGYGDIERYNPESKIPTPNLNRLADEGMRLTDAHSPSSVCSPTRYGLLTGRYAWRTTLERGVLSASSPSLIDTARLTLPRLFKNHGYTTGAVGKWHLGFGSRDSTLYDQPLDPGPNALGFDYFFGFPTSNNPPFVYVVNKGVEAEPTEWTDASLHRRQGGEGYWRAGLIAPGFRHVDVLPRVEKEALGFIQRRGGEGPFFLYVPLSAPHTPWLPLPEFAGTSGAGHYGDFVVQVDHVVGQIVRALDDLPRETLLIFTSDNGAHWLESERSEFGHDANGPWRGQKADIWEGGHRVPLIVRWPGRVEAGSVSDELVSLTDIMATAAALLGAKLPHEAAEDSYDFLPVLTGSGPGSRTAMIQHSMNGTFAIRRGDWKLILGLGSGGFTQPRRIEPGPGDPAGQLYNLATDPMEQRNLYASHPEVVIRLTSLLDQHMSEGRSRPCSNFY